MTIEFINNKNRFFDEVKALGRKNSATLGFMPEGGFEDHARNKCIIIAHERDQLMGYLMYRIVSRYSRISIVHLCVADSYRGRGVSTSLLDALREKYQKSFRGISLNCRTDYIHAKQLWENYGFVPINEVRSRSYEENHLNTWWYGFGQPDLFSNYESSKVKALLDTNIIVKLREAQVNEPLNATEDPRGLLADWLTDETDLCFSAEVYNEVNRDNDKERANRTRVFLANFTQAQFDAEKQKGISKELESIIHGNSANDISDRKQLASCIASHIPYFITYDEGILNKRESIESAYPIQLFNPQEFIIQIDQLLHEDEYLPNQLKGVVFHSVAKLNSRDTQLCIEKFWNQHEGETKKSFVDKISQIINSDSGELSTVKRQNEIVAFYGILKEQSKVIIEFVRVLEDSYCNSLFFQIISDVLNNDCLKDDKEQIVIRELHLKPEWKSILLKFGFVPYSSDCYTKYAIDRQIDRQEIGSFIQESGIPIDIDMSNEAQLISVESMLFPLKIKNLDLPTYIIPIISHWAGQLFDFSIASEDIFGADPDRLWSFENVYYRHAHAINEKAPARILWYVSGRDKGFSRSKSIVASSYLTEVQTGKPKELFRLYKHYGIYAWNNIYELCGQDINKDIRTLKFSHTEVFNHPVSYKTVTEVFTRHGRKVNTFASPVLVSDAIFFDIYNLGR